MTRQPGRPRATVLRNARIFTADPDRPWAGSVTLAEGRVQALDQAAPEGAEVIDLDGAFVLPGFVDAHTHLVEMGASAEEVGLVDAAGIAEIQARVAAAATEGRARVIGNSWLFPALEGRAPHKDLLDAVVPDVPVYLQANDLHSTWCNSAALRELGIDRDTPDPIGGTIERDVAGEATGLLSEMAALGLARGFLAAQVTDADRDTWLRAGMARYLADGVTTVVDMGVEEHDLAAFERALAADALPLRVIGHWLVKPSATEAENLAQVATALAHARRLDGDRLRITGIKIMADGVIDSCTASMAKPYADGSNAAPIWGREALIPVVVAADAAGLQIAIHAIGDQASAIALDALEEAIRVNGPRERRHRMEHLEVVSEESVARLARLGVVASMQPVHADPAVQDNWRAVLGDERVERGYPWREMTDAGAVLAFGTDAPTAPHLPLHNMYVATTRRSALVEGLPANTPHLAVPLAEALTHATRDAAYASRMEGLVGAIAPGRVADLVVLAADPFATAPEDLLTTEVLRTFVAGVERTQRAAGSSVLA
ncbi:amidohydrolase [Nocardioides nitrophenolicus]|uniref:amidohydrolase n=1 Tax=Nocardioides nitrophenolicus TaxID=60489 RepID=UPI00195BD2BD|nr:amidohydrolase [Nocardioides nitrophenolicus]MBM7519721.1 putative amidohydrolase YtcJ [Nocardioides nitrophenolicus]